MPDENQQPIPPVNQIDSVQPKEQGTQPIAAGTMLNVPQTVAPQVVQPTSPGAPVPPEPTTFIPEPIVLQQRTEPTGMVNGQPFSQPVLSPNSQFDQMGDSAPSKWRYVFIVLGILQAIGVALFFFVILWASQQAKAGVSGTEFIGLILLVTLVPALGLIAALNLIGLPIYMRKHKPHGIGLVFSILSLAVSIILAAYGAYTVYQFRVALPREIHQISQQTRQESQVQQQQFVASNAKPEITEDEAIQLLKDCKLKGFYYTNQTDKSDPANGGWGELSSTGVVLTNVDGQPYRISIANKLIPELVPIAREAQRTCGGPQFWHGGTYEQYQDGHWYFKDEVVN